VQISKVINEVWRQYEMNHKPAYVLNFRIPSHQYDINVSPDKREVMLSNVSGFSCCHACNMCVDACASVQEAALLEAIKVALNNIWEPSRRTFVPSTLQPMLSADTFRSPEEEPVSSVSTAPSATASSNSMVVDDVDATPPEPSVIRDDSPTVSPLHATAASIRSMRNNPGDKAAVAERRDLEEDRQAAERQAKREAIIASMSKTGSAKSNRRAVSIVEIAAKRTVQPAPAVTPQREEVAVVEEQNHAKVSFIENVEDHCGCDHDDAANATVSALSEGVEAIPDSPTPVSAVSQVDDAVVLVTTALTRPITPAGKDSTMPVISSQSPQKRKRAPPATSQAVDELQSETVNISLIRNAYLARKQLMQAGRTRQETPVVGSAAATTDIADSFVLFGDSAGRALQTSTPSVYKLCPTTPPTANITEEEADEEDGLQLAADLQGATSEASVAKCAAASKSSVAKESLERSFAKVLHKSNFIDMSHNVFGQFNNGFIIAATGSDLYILDQHACDEKFQYEYLQEHTIIHEQQLLAPRSIDLTAAEEHCIIHNMEIFNANGFHFQQKPDAAPGRRLQLTAIPFSKNTTFGDEDVRELASLLNDMSSTGHPDGHIVRLPKASSMFASRACRSAVMIGTALGRDAMKKIVAQLAELNQPWNCPHGRPTLRHLVDASKVNVVLADAGELA
jgi:DNA mismatch repair ATPase MutL